MGELANYSIETDQLIWLAFKDGHSLRVPVGLLPKYLSPRDLQKVRRAMKLRRDFFRHNMPTALMVLMALSLVAAVAASSQVLALLGRRSVPSTPPSHTEMVRNTNTLSPAPSPVPSPAANPVATVARRRTAARAKPVPTWAPVSSGAVAGTAAVSVTPIATVPTPSPEPVSSPEASPLPSPTPAPSPGGQVLGDATGPDPTPSPAPTIP